jgi:O-antigen biosynthesis protein
LTGKLVFANFPPQIEFEQASEDARASASISIVVPIHDSPREARQCLAGLEKYAPESEVILVDDASVLTETLEVIRHFGSRNGWKVARHEKALGHSEACRAGTNLATRPYLCLLNSDTIVTPWCWRCVKEVFECDQQIAVSGPSTSYSRNLQTLAIAADQIRNWNDNQICAFAKLLLVHCREPVLFDIPWAAGFAFFIRRNLWEQLGGFDRNLPDYGNEVELCSRIAKKGYRIVWIRNSYIHHLGHRSYRDSIGDEEIRVRTRFAESYIREKLKATSEVSN